MRLSVLGVIVLGILLAITGCAELQEFVRETRVASSQPSVARNENTGATVGGFVGGAVAGPGGSSIGATIGYVVGGILTIGGLLLARKNKTAENLTAHSDGIVDAISALAPIVASTIEQPKQN